MSAFQSIAEPVAEIIACDANHSIVSNGAAAGELLANVAAKWGEGLLGRSAMLSNAFPIAARWIGAAAPSPVWVAKPADAAVGQAWYVVNADPGGCISRGLGAASGAQDTVPDEDADGGVLHSISARRGHCHYIPAGVAHGVRGGVFLAEIQPSVLQNEAIDLSDADARRGLTVCSREDIAVFEKRTHVTSLFTTVTRMMTTPSYQVERVRFIGEYEQEIPYAEPVFWMVLEGRGAVQYGRRDSVPFQSGDFVILPADLKDAKLRTETDCVWLEITLPTPSDLAELPRPDAATLRADDTTRGTPIQINISAGKKR